MKNHFLIGLPSVMLILSLNQITNAQKLPSEQKISVYAPANVKIDGKPVEWIGKFQAKNSATQLTYVMANDEENLYLTIQASETNAIGKIFHGGISLIVRSKTDKKATPATITYPVVTIMQRSGIVIPLRDKESNADTAAIISNLAIGKAAKTIAVSGIADITDPDISVYNDLGIKAQVQADNSRTMTFEYRLPLKYIKHLIDETGSFDYSIVVNGAKVGKSDVVVLGGSNLGGGGGAPIMASAPASGIGVVRLDAGGDTFSPTDLKASYTLAKK